MTTGIFSFFSQLPLELRLSIVEFHARSVGASIEDKYNILSSSRQVCKEWVAYVMPAWKKYALHKLERTSKPEAPSMLLVSTVMVQTYLAKFVRYKTSNERAQFVIKTLGRLYILLSGTQISLNGKNILKDPDFQKWMINYFCHAETMVPNVPWKQAIRNGIFMVKIKLAHFENGLPKEMAQFAIHCRKALNKLLYLVKLKGYNTLKDIAAYST
jgi:hypothetical protein